MIEQHHNPKVWNTKAQRKAFKRQRQAYRAVRAIVNPESGETFKAKPGSRVEREARKLLSYIASRTT